MERDEYYRMFTLEKDFWWYRVLHELTEYFVRKKSKEKEITILDAGCGTGRMMEICSSYGNVYGIDFSTDAVELARSRNLVNVQQGDLNNYPLPDETYDTIISLDVLYHSGIRDDLAVAARFHKALAKNGILILNLPAFEFLRRSHDVVVQTRKRYVRGEFVKQLESIGYNIKLATYRMPLLFFMILLSKLAGGKHKKEESESDLKKIPDWLNNLLMQMGRIENSMIKTGIRFPVGSSLFIVASKGN